MTTDIFKIFKKSIEQVKVKKTKRGALTDSIVYEVTIDAIVKRRKGMAESINDSEDRETQTTVHFRSKDLASIEEGNFVEIDGTWHVIERLPHGTDFLQGKLKFIKVYLGQQIEGGSSEPNWS